MHITRTRYPILVFPHGHRRGGATPCAATRHKDHRLIKWFNNDPTELYDLASDISEKENRQVDARKDEGT